MAITIDDVPPLDAVATLFREYAASLAFDLCFQGFDGEVASLPGPYAPPRGALLLARVDGADAGCVALRPLDAETGEVKRLYVRDVYRGRGVARALVDALLVRARAARYRRLRLDTVPSMQAAQALYRSYGFREIAPYTDNPVPGALFLELDLP